MMASNFSFLDKDPKYKEIAIACIEAEKSLAISYSAAALQTRRALEIAVKWAYRYDGDLTVPYQDNLSSLIHDHNFKDILDAKLFPRIKFIISLGNKAAHTVKPVRRDQAVESLRNLYDFISWVDYSYSTETHNEPFNASLLQDGSELEKKNRKMQEDLAAKEAAWKAEREKLEKLLRSAEERQQTKEQREENQESRDFDCDDISEFKTRKIYIDLALEMAGWAIGTNCQEEVEVSGMPNDSGSGYVDYVLYADNGVPLAVIEAKRTSIDPRKGKIQAKLYADCLEKEHNVRPLIFFTNGFETWFWDDKQYPERLVFGFFTKDELDWCYYRKANKKTISSVNASDDIANRPYQKKAIQAVCDTLEKGQRKALLVMATGSGKTRTAISLVDVLLQNIWIKNILFLADRRELVKQAKKSFTNLLPNLSICNLLDNKDDPNSRMVFSTYPTMMNAIDENKTKDGSQLFTSGHFDLLIIDESHRSIYKKYQDIFTYFDGFLLGLTATPKNDLDKNTYSIFDIEDDVPTFAYELEKAIEEKYLVPYNTIETKMKFMEQGIHYDELTDEEKEQWEDTFDDGVSDISGAALNKFLFNSHTVDTVLHDLMDKGIHVNGGDTIGKTIIFATNTRHADFILERFNKLYPEYAGRVAATIYNGIKYVDRVIEELSTKEKYPQIAISVDMLDTGIDIPELVNLVFFKKVRSKAKFWQMIGRGTRLCLDLFGVGQDKESFLIFDYCSNFEYFRVNKNGIEGKTVKSLTENLFNIKVKIAQELEHLDFQTDEYNLHRAKLVEQLHKALTDIDETRFSSRLRIKYIHRYNKVEKWESISDQMVRELEEQIAPLIIPVEENELAKRFDYLMFTIELAYLQGIPASKPKVKVINTAERLAEKGNLAQVQRHAKLIENVQTDEYWENADIFAHEKVREALRDLLVLLEKDDTEIYYTSFTDEILETKENPGEYDTDEFQSYRKKVNNYLKQHQNDLVIYKLMNNKELTESDYKHMEKILWNELGTKEDYQKEFGDEHLLKLIAGLVGLERSAANELFSDFISDQSLNSNQMDFVTLIVNHIVENGTLDKSILNDHPFNKHGSLVNLFEGKMETVKSIVKRIDELNSRIAVGA
ncbi:DEAD/DEAH box helicase family protein [Desulfobacterales bacterium HSG17]|nr:DEAD/DEAH box helicase family protein [Desulfobacterales bacterium HSG17]